MTSKVNQIYSKLPVSFQNVAVSLKGWTFTRQRYGNKYHKHVNNLMRSQWLSAEEFRSLQVRELRNLIKEAVENTSYYRETLVEFLPSLESLTLENIHDIPLLGKSAPRTRTQDFVNKSRLRIGYTEAHTSGTSGTPLTFPYDYDSLRYNLSFRERQYRWAGITGTEVSARFSGRLILGNHKGPPFWRYNAAEKQWLFSTYHMTEENLAHYADKLISIQPVYLDGYPSALYVLAKWLKNHKREGKILPWAIFTTAETLDGRQRDLIESVFKCRVFDFYSSSEGAPYITQCAAGNYHINPESGIVEILRPDGRPAADGEIGELVVTSFFQRTVPLIRYCIGDTGVRQDGVCPCGRQMPLVESLTGRIDDLLWTEERGFVGRLDPAFKSLPSSIIETQIAQTGLNEIVVRYVPDKPLFKKEHLQMLIGELHRRLGQNVEIKPIQLTQIPRDKNGKFRSVVREIDLP